VDEVAAEEWRWSGINRPLLHRVDPIPRSIDYDGRRYWIARCGSIVVPVHGVFLDGRRRCLDCMTDCYFRYPTKDGSIIR
jgi:hypothetical protein